MSRASGEVAYRRGARSAVPGVLLQLLEELADLRGLGVVRRELQERLVGRDRRREVVRGLRGRGDLELHARILGLELRNLLVLGDGLGGGRLRLRGGGGDLRLVARA